jgi:hypothetical protein
MTRRPILNTSPAIIARASGARIEQAQGEYGSIYSVIDSDGETRFRSNRKEAASAWLEGYAAGRRDQRMIETDQLYEAQQAAPN